MGSKPKSGNEHPDVADLATSVPDVTDLETAIPRLPDEELEGRSESRAG